MLNNRQKLLWYKFMGVDEIIGNQPINRLQKKQLNIDNTIDLQDGYDYNNDLENISTLAPREVVRLARVVASKCNSLEELHNTLKKYEWCPIKKTATNTVFYDGVKTSKIMLIGEAPGANEDLQGIPFCGDSGKLLDNMLSYINLSREKNIYITNTLFWRPPGNRKPTTEEIEICQPFIERHICLFKPELIILVGGTSCSALIDSKEGVSKLRNKIYRYNNPYLEKSIPMCVIFHPSYLLRQPSQKKYMWYDLLKIEEFIKENNIIF